MTKNDASGRVLLSQLDGTSDVLMAGLAEGKSTDWVHIDADGFEGLVKVARNGGRCALVSTPFTLRSEWVTMPTPEQVSRDFMLSAALERVAVTVAYATPRGAGESSGELVAAHDIYSYPDNVQLALDAVVDTDLHLPRKATDLAHEALHEAILEQLPDAIEVRAEALRGFAGGARYAAAEIWISQDMIDRRECPSPLLELCGTYLDYATDAGGRADLIEASAPEYIKEAIGELCASNSFSAACSARDYAAFLLAESEQVDRIARGRVNLEAARDLEPTMEECLTRSLAGKLDSLLPASGGYRGDKQVVLSCGGREIEASARDIIARTMFATKHLLSSDGGPDGSPVDIIDVDAVMDADGNKIWDIAEAPQSADEFERSPIEAALARPEAARRIYEAERRPAGIAWGLCNTSDFWLPDQQTIVFTNASGSVPEADYLAVYRNVTPQRLEELCDYGFDQPSDLMVEGCPPWFAPATVLEGPEVNGDVEPLTHTAVKGLVEKLGATRAVRLDGLDPATVRCLAQIEEERFEREAADAGRDAVAVKQQEEPAREAKESESRDNADEER